MGLLQTVSRVTIGSSKGRAHASHLVGSTQRIQGTRGWDYVDHHWQRPTFLCPPFEKHSPAAAMQSASSGRIAIYFDHVVKARRPMSRCALHSHSSFWMSAPPHGLYARECSTQDKRCSFGSRTFRSPSQSRTQKHHILSVRCPDDQPARVLKYQEIVCEGFPCRGWKLQCCSWR